MEGRWRCEEDISENAMTPPSGRTSSLSHRTSRPGTSTSTGRHQHRALKPADSPHINVSVEQIDYRPLSLVRLRRLAGTQVVGERPKGATTLERVEGVEGVEE